MQLQSPSLRQELSSALSLPKWVLSRSPSCDSSDWSLASVPHRTPDSSWESDPWESGPEGYGCEDEDSGEACSPEFEEMEIEIADTTDNESFPSAESSPPSLGSQAPKKAFHVCTCENMEPDQPSSPKIFRIVSERAQLSRLGFQYRYGCGPFPQNLAKSSKFYTEAAELGCGDALAALAVAHIFGIGVSCSRDIARSLLRKALLKGSIDALEIRALCCMAGTFDGKRNYNSCLELLAMGVARNSPACLLWAGFCFELGLGAKPDPYAAKEAYLAARESSTMRNLVLQTRSGAMNSNDPWALTKTALFLLHASGDPDHRQTAIDCLKQAALLGFTDAQVYLAICLIQGKWLQKDSSAALYWLKQKEQNEVPHPVAQRILHQLD